MILIISSIIVSLIIIRIISLIISIIISMILILISIIIIIIMFFPESEAKGSRLVDVDLRAPTRVHTWGPFFLQLQN